MFTYNHNDKQIFASSEQGGSEHNKFSRSHNRMQNTKDLYFGKAARV